MIKIMLKLTIQLIILFVTITFVSSKQLTLYSCVAGDIDKATDEVTLTEVRDEKDRICDGNYCKIHKGHHVTFELTFKPSDDTDTAKLTMGIGEKIDKVWVYESIPDLNPDLLGGTEAQSVNLISQLTPKPEPKHWRIPKGSAKSFKYRIFVPTLTLNGKMQLKFVISSMTPTTQLACGILKGEISD